MTDSTPIALVHNSYPLLKEVMPPCTLDKGEREDLAAKLLQTPLIILWAAQLLWPMLQTRANL